VFYYYDTGEKPRREIPLGPDFIAALRKYAELHQIDKPKREIVFGDVITKYRTEVLPTLADNTIRVQKSDLKLLEANFKDAPLDAVKPAHIHKFLDKYKDKLRARKQKHTVHIMSLLVNLQGKPLTKATLRTYFEEARATAIEQHPELADAIRAFWFYDLRAKAADDTADKRGARAASDLLGQVDEKTTRRHYIRKGQIVKPTK